MEHSPLVEDWEELGRKVEVAGEMVFVIDQLATEDSHHPPLLVLHGFPTSSVDFAEVLPALHARRRVVLLDLPGFGFSDKIDRAYSLFDQADVVESVVSILGIDEVDLLTHDMGDSVGGELLARSIDETLGFTVRRRVLSNGSIYLDLAHLTAGQQVLESLGDAALPVALAPDLDRLTQSLVDTLAPREFELPHVRERHLCAAAELVMRNDGHLLLPRLIRYLEERRQHESRWTGAIESHPSPLTIVWGDLDPIAVWEMTERLCDRRSETTRIRLGGVGHYPMIEAPEPFGDAVCAALDNP